MYYIVGLGNPGEKYEKTRHNIGWDTVRYFVSQHNLPQLVTSSKFVGEVSEGVLGGEELTVLLPHTFMNKSGTSVKKLVTGLDEGSRLIVVYDDIDIPIGELKISVGRGSGGHNGVQSIIDALGTKDFVRIRVGIAPKAFWTGKARRPEAGAPMTRHVLGSFTKREQRTLEEVLQTVDNAIICILQDGVEKAMGLYNGR